MPLDRRTFPRSSPLLGGAIGLGALPSLTRAVPAGAEPHASAPARTAKRRAAITVEREVLAAWHANKGN